MAATLASRGGLRTRLLLFLSKPGIGVSSAGPAAAFCTSVTSARVAVNGVHLHYQRTGEGEHAVLLLPGMLGSGKTDFAPQLKNLNKKLFTLVAWDPRGYGHSRPPDRDFPVDFFERDAKDAVDLMKTLKFKKVSLLGWSDGGITALIAAAKYPSYIHKMVIWGANVYVTDEDERIYQGIRDVSKWSEKARKPLEALYGYDYFSKTCEKWVDGIAQFKQFPDGNICRHLLPLVQCPTLIVHGEKDPLVPRFHADFVHERVKGSRVFSNLISQSFSCQGSSPMVYGFYSFWLELACGHTKTVAVRCRKQAWMEEVNEIRDQPLHRLKLHLMPEGKHNLHLRFADEFNKLVEDFLQ